MKKCIFNQCNGLWYELQGDYYIPCLVLDEAGTSPIGMCMYLRFLLFPATHLGYIQICPSHYLLTIFLEILQETNIVHHMSQTNHCYKR